MAKTESQKNEEIKLENIKNFDEEYKKRKVIPNEYKKNIIKRILKNTAVAIIAIAYLIALNILSLNLETNLYIICDKIVCVILAIVSVIYFELSYRQDNGYLFMHGVEFLVIATITLFSIYAYEIYFETYNIILTIISIVIVIYYIIKTICTIINMKKEYYKAQNDIKDIVKK